MIHLLGLYLYWKDAYLFKLLARLWRGRKFCSPWIGILMGWIHGGFLGPHLLLVLLESEYFCGCDLSLAMPGVG
jgi:hypothetical protein